MNTAAQLLVLTDKIMNYRGNTALFLLLPRGYRKFFTIPRYYREILPIYRGITAFPITVSLSTETDLVKQKTDGRAYTYFFRYNHHLCQCTVYSKLGSFF